MNRILGRIHLPLFRKQSIEPVNPKKAMVKPLKEALKLFESKNVNERRAAAERLRLLNSSDSIPALLKHLEISEDPTVISDILDTLNNLHDIRATEKLMEFIEKSPQAPTIEYLHLHRAIYALTRSKDPRGAPFLLNMLKKFQPSGRTNVVGMGIISGLGSYKYTKAYGEIFKFVKEKPVDRMLREYAVRALLEINPNRAREPLLSIFESETDWSFRRSLIVSIIYSLKGPIDQRFKKYLSHEDPYIVDLIDKYLAGKINEFGRLKQTESRKYRPKYFITHDWWHDVIEYRRWINDLFKTKFNSQGDLFKQDETIVRDIKNECTNEIEFNSLILLVASQIDLIQGNLLDPFITQSPGLQPGTINKLEAFLNQCIPSHDAKIIDNLRLIHKVRSKKAPIHITSDLPDLLSRLGFHTLPPDWKNVWIKLKDLYLETLKLLKEALESR